MSYNPYGIMVHTTGIGPCDKALREGTDVLTAALKIYESMGPVGPHYVISPLGAISNLTPPSEKAHHCKVSADQRRSFLDGEWENMAPKWLVRDWKERFPGVKSPQHLYPSRTPNDDYIGIELIPCGTWVDGRGSWKPVFGRPMLTGGRYTTSQYVQLARLCLHLEEEHGIDVDLPGRLVGHSDINPLTRPGWDPGFYKGYFNWNVLRELISELDDLQHRGDFE